MGGLDVALGMILALCSLGCLIYLLVGLAKEKGALLAVLGFFFPINPFV